MRARKKPVEINYWPIRSLLDYASHHWTLLPTEVLEAYNSGSIIFQPEGVTVITLE